MKLETIRAKVNAGYLRQTLDKSTIFTTEEKDWICDVIWYRLKNVR